jgi:fibronectin type 3 domain-containing protein
MNKKIFFQILFFCFFAFYIYCEPQNIIPVTTTATNTSAIPVNLPQFNISFDTSAIDSIKIQWQKPEEKEFNYNIYRKISSNAKASDFEKINTETVKENIYVDTKITSSTTYFYKIEAIDNQNNKILSDAASVTSLPLIYPYKPNNFKARQDIEKVSLIWDAPQRGSFDIKGYNIYRGKTSDNLEFYKFLEKQTKFNDEEVEPAIRYFYSLSTVDVKGNESEKTEIQSVIPFPIQKTGLILVPTGYRNNIYDNFGLNADILFTYIIGSINGEHLDEDIKKSDGMSKIGVSLLTADVKWTFLNDFDFFASFGVGGTYTLLFKDSLGASSMSGVSKTFTKDTTLVQMYGGYISSSIRTFYNITLHSGVMFSPENYSQTSFMAWLSPYISIEQTGENYIKPSSFAYFIGFDRRIPFFEKLPFRIEYIVPWQSNENPALPDYYLINSYIDRFINFNVGYFHFPGGYSWIGYVSFRFTVYPNPYK